MNYTVLINHSDLTPCEIQEILDYFDKEDKETNFYIRGEPDETN